ncbi:MAG: DinB family protein [Bacteroidetes bacterium]|nr:DinB family protein [Bacteroidota bacterium]
MAKPVKGTYPSYYETYIDKVKEDDLFEALEAQEELISAFLDNISEEKSQHAYAPGKWTVKELLQHVIDAERVFSYRALRFARKDETALPAFDENNYAANSFANERTWKSLVEEMKTVRRSTRQLFESFNKDMLANTGIASDRPVNVQALGFIIIGHFLHHKNVIASKYLVAKS